MRNGSSSDRTCRSANSSRGNRAHLRKRRIKAVIPKKKDQAANRKKKGSQGGRPVSHDADLYKERNTVERQINKLKAWRGIATRYDKIFRFLLRSYTTHRTDPFV